MNRRCSILALIALAFNALAFAPAPVYKERKAPKGLLEQMQGRWKVSGEPGKALVIERDVAIDYEMDEKGKKLHMTLGPKRTPATVDFRHEPTGMVLQGIVKVEGDRLTICLANPLFTTEHPTRFETEGEKYKVIIFERVK